MTDYPDYAVVFDDPPYFEGDSLYIDVLYRDNTGTAIDLTGATFDFILGSLTEATSGISVAAGSATGEIVITGTTTAMSALTAGTYEIELAYVIGSYRKTIFHGTFLVRESSL